MDISFIICTHDPNQSTIDACIKTIYDLQIPKYEVIVIGGIRNSKNLENVTFIDFDETVKPGWITKKKNDAAKVAKYDVLCMLHDYYAFDSNWYQEWTKFGAQWDIATNAVHGINGVRIWSDWTIWDHPTIPRFSMLPYTEQSLTKYQYISGGFFLVKRNFFLENLFNEALVSYGEEDVEWSLRVRHKAKVVCNQNSIVRQLKWHSQLRKWRKYTSAHNKLIKRQKV